MRIIVSVEDAFYSHHTKLAQASNSDYSTSRTVVEAASVSQGLLTSSE